MRGCLLGFVTLVAVGLIATTIWYGAIGLLGPGGGAAATAVVGLRRPGTETPASGSGAAPRPTQPVGAARPAVITPNATGETELLRLTDAELTEALRRALAQEQGGAALVNPSVRVGSGRLELTGQVQGLVPLPIDIRVIGQPTIRNGAPAIIVERIEGLGVPLPDPAARQLELALGAVSLAPMPAGIEVTRLAAQDGVLVVYGRRR